MTFPKICKEDLKMHLKKQNRLPKQFGDTATNL